MAFMLTDNRILDDNGRPLSGGKVYVYEAGTTTPIDSFPTAAAANAGTPVNSNPVILNAAGIARIYGKDDVVYKVVIKDRNDTTIETIDNISLNGGESAAAAASAALAASASASSAASSASAAASSASSAAASADAASESAIAAQASANLATPTVVNFTGDGSTTDFELPYAVEKNSTNVFVSGQYQGKGAYAIVGGTTLRFLVAPANGVNIEVNLAATSTMVSGDTTQVNYNNGASGAVTRSVRDKLREIVSVKDFGALPNSDASAAIQKAIDYVASLGGGAVLGDNESVFLALGVEVKTGVTLRNIRLKTAVATEESLACIGFASDATDAAIEDVEIDGNRDSQTATVVQGIAVRGTRNRVERCHVFNTKRTGIAIQPGSTRCVVKGNIVHDVTRFGISHEYSATDKSTHCDITDNHIYNTGSAGINLIAGDDSTGTVAAGVEHFRITGNLVTDTGLDEIAGAIGGYCPNNKYVLIANNVMENINNHMHHVGGDYISVIGNIGRNITNAGILIRNWPNQNGTGGDLGQNVVIMGNQIHLVNTVGNGDAINVSNYKNVTVANNSIYGTADAAINIIGEKLGRTIRTTDVAVVGNVIAEADGGAHPLPEVGINIENADRVSVTGNVVNSCQDHGIRVAGSTNVSVSGNVASNSKSGSGILVIESGTGGTASSQVALTGNTCVGNASFGIQISGAVARPLIVGNILRGNTTGQLNPGGASNATIADNTGYRTRNGGTASVADGGTIGHGLSAAPTRVVVSSRQANRIVSVTGVSATEITVAVKNHDGTAVEVAEGLYWEASLDQSSV